MTRLPDPARSRAVLIGCSRYRHLEALPAVVNNLFAFRSVLTDPAIGGFTPVSCMVLGEPREVRGVFETLQKAAQEAEDTLLVYFCGHGLLGERNELHLALADADRGLLPFTALAYDWVKAALAQTRARNRVVILDCCFAGRAISDMASTQDGIIEQTSIEGTYILAAAPADKSALAPEGATFTAFTGVLLELLRTGIPDGPELITLDVLFPWLRSTLSSRRLPQPRRSGTDTVTGLALTRNPAHRHPARIDLAAAHDAYGASASHAAPTSASPFTLGDPHLASPTGWTAVTRVLRRTRPWGVPAVVLALLLALIGFVTHPVANPVTSLGHNTPPAATPALAATPGTAATTTAASTVSPSGLSGNRLVEQATGKSGGLTLTVTLVAPAYFKNENTRVELTARNDTAKEMKLPLDFDNSTFTDNDGNWLPASNFYTSSEWSRTIPAHQYRKEAVGFERMFPGRATAAVLVLKFSAAPWLGPGNPGGPDTITVRDIKLGPG